jgi:hypothetical protein
MRTVRAAVTQAEASNPRVSVFGTTPHKHTQILGKAPETVVAAIENVPAAGATERRRGEAGTNMDDPGGPRCEQCDDRTRTVVAAHGRMGPFFGAAPIPFLIAGSLNGDTMTCAGSLILHLDGMAAGCTLDDDCAGCAGRELPHVGSPILCYARHGGRCNRCGVHTWTP